MRHSSIKLTMDTYGHLLTGAKAAAVVQTASLTAIPTDLLRATGTDDLVPTWFLFGSKQDAKGCDDVRDGAVDPRLPWRLISTPNPRKTRRKATQCGLVRREAKVGLV